MGKLQHTWHQLAGLGSCDPYDVVNDFSDCSIWISLFELMWVSPLIQVTYLLTIREIDTMGQWFCLLWIPTWRQCSVHCSSDAFQRITVFTSTSQLPWRNQIWWVRTRDLKSWTEGLLPKKTKGNLWERYLGFLWKECMDLEQVVNILELWCETLTCVSDEL